MALDFAELVSRAPRTSYSGFGYRQQAPGYEPLRGQGARLLGGRFNHPISYPVLYLCTTRACAIAEFRRSAERQPIGLTGFLPRTLFRYELELMSMRDLTERAVLAATGIDHRILVDEERTMTRQLGEFAFRFGYQGIVDQSATGVDMVLALFPDNLGTGRIVAEVSETWTELKDLE